MGIASLDWLGRRCAALVGFGVLLAAGVVLAPTPAAAQPGDIAAAPTASNVGARSFRINWVKVAGATKYSVRWRVADPQGDWLPNNATNTRELGDAMTSNVTGLTTDTTYDYEVRAGNADGFSDWVQSAAPVLVTAGVLEAQVGDVTRFVFEISTSYFDRGLRDLFPLTPAFHPRIYEYHTKTISTGTLWFGASTKGGARVAAPRGNGGTGRSRTDGRPTSLQAHKANQPFTYRFTVQNGGSVYEIRFATGDIPISSTLVPPPTVQAKPKALTLDTIILGWVNSPTTNAAHYVRWRTAATDGTDGVAGNSDDVAAGEWQSSDGVDDAHCADSVTLPTDCGSDRSTNSGGIEFTNLVSGTTYEFGVIAIADSVASDWVTATATTNALSAGFAPAASTVAEDAGSVALAVLLSAAAPAALEIPFTATGTTVGDDYTITASPITIPMGMRSAIITVTVADDAVSEFDETLILTLGEGDGYELGTANAYTLTITDNEPPGKVPMPGARDINLAGAFEGGWDAPAGGLSAHPFEARWRVKSPLGAWSSKRDQAGGGDLGSGRPAPAICVNGLSVMAGCYSAEIGSRTLTDASALRNGVEYEFQIRAHNDHGAGEWSEPGSGMKGVTKAAKPAVVVTNLMGTGVDGGVALTWDAVASAGGYRLRYRLTDGDGNGNAGPWQGWVNPTSNQETVAPTIGDDASGDGYLLPLADATTAASFTQMGLAGAEEYEVGIAVVKGEVLGDFVDVTATTIVLPDPPANVATPTAAAIAATSFSANWAAANLAEEYQVRWRTAATTTPVAAAGMWQDTDGDDAECNDSDATNDGDCGVEVSDALTYAITGLTPDTAYDFAVLAKNIGGISPTWVGASATTLVLPNAAFTTTASSLAEDGGDVELTIMLDEIAPADAVLAFTLTGTATEGESADYTLAPTVTIAQGQQSATLTITVNDDTAPERAETVIVTLDDGGVSYAAGDDKVYTLTITDNEAPAQITTATARARNSSASFNFGWLPPAGTLGAHPYEVRWRVRSPLGRWTTEKGSSLGVAPSGAFCGQIYGLPANCVAGIVAISNVDGILLQTQVRAFNDNGNAPWSGVRTVRVFGGAPAAPDAPRELAFTAAAGGMDLTWTKPTGTVNAYRVRYRVVDTDAATDGNQAGAWQGWVNPASNQETVAPTIGDDTSGNGFNVGAGTSYQLRELTDGTNYEVGVAATRSNVLGAWTDILTTAGVASQVPAAPSMPTASAVAGNSFTMSWTQTTTATHYLVRWRLQDADGAGAGTDAGPWRGAGGNDAQCNDGDPNTDADCGQNVGNVLSYDIAGLTAASVYEYEVRAVNAMGAGAWSTNTQLTGPASTDSTLTALTVSGASAAFASPAAFDGATTDYFLTIAAAAGTVTFTPTLPVGASARGTVTNAATATPSGDANGITNNILTVTNAVGVIEYTLTVTAEDGSTTDYNFFLAAGPNISSLTLTDNADSSTVLVLEPAFNRWMFDYTAGTNEAKTEVPAAIQTLDLKAIWTGSGGGSRIELNGNDIGATLNGTSGGAASSITLVSGTNTIALKFGGAGAHAAKAALAYTFVIEREESGPPASFTAADSEASEGDGTTDIMIKLAEAGTVAALIDFTATGADGSADYTITASPITIATGQTTGTITVTLIDDSVVESAEEVTITLQVGTGYELGDPITHTLTIRDNELPPQVTAASRAAMGNNAVIVVAWDVPAGDLIDNPYEVRHRVQSPLGEWVSTQGAALTLTAPNNCVGAYALTAGGCVEAEITVGGAGVAYDYQVRAQSQAGAGAWSTLASRTNSGTATTAPLAPTGLSATPILDGLQLTWVAPASTTPADYRVRYRTAATTSPQANAGAWQGWVEATDINDSPEIGDDTSENGFAIGQTAVPYDLQGLMGGMEYDVAVAAVVGEVVGAWIETTATPAANFTPAVPMNLATKDVTSTSFTVTWEKSLGATAYHVRWRTSQVGATAAGDWFNAMGADADCNGADGDTNAACGEVLGDVAEYAIPNLSPSVGYDFEVRASNSQGESGWAQGTMQNTPLGISFAPDTARTVAEDAGALMLQVMLSTAAPDALSLAFAVTGTADANDYTLAASPLTIAQGATTAQLMLTVTNDTRGESNETVVITLEDGTGYGLGADDSYTLTITDNDVPEQITPRSSNGGSDATKILVGWNAPAGTLVANTPYDLRYRVKSPLGEWTTSENITTTTPTSCISGLQAGCHQVELTVSGPGVTYEYQVRARSAAGAGAWSALRDQRNNGTLTQRLGAPSELQADPVAGMGSASLVWKAPAGTPAAYRVRYRTSPDTGAGTAAGAWQGWIEADDITDSPIIGDDTSENGFAIANTLTYTLDDLAGETDYDIGVAAVVGEVVGEWAEVQVSIEALAAPDAPTNLSATGDTPFSFTLTWSDAPRASTYQVRWRVASPPGPWLNAEGADAECNDTDTSNDNDCGAVVEEATELAITVQEGGIAYDYEVLARNSFAASGWTSGAITLTPPETDNTITALTITDSSGAVDVSPTFNSGRFTYDIFLNPLASGNHALTFAPMIADEATAAGVPPASALSDVVLTDGSTARVTNNVVTFDGARIGRFNYELTVTAQARTTRTYTFTIVNGPDLNAITLTDTTEGGTELTLNPDVMRDVFAYTANAPFELEEITFQAVWGATPASGTLAGFADEAGAPATATLTGEDGDAGETIPLAVGANAITLTFAADAGREPIVYTVTIQRAPEVNQEEMTANAEAVAKSVSAAVVLSGVLDAVSQNAFDATGSFTPFVDVTAERATEPRQALVPIAPLLLSEQPQSRDADWRELLGASSFRLGITAGEIGEALSGALGGGEWSVWGSGDVRGFSGGGEVETEGLGYSIYLGTDYRKGNWLAGIAAGYSSTTADVTADGAKTSSEFWLAGGYPYLRYSWQNQIDAWLLLGAGGGQLTLQDAEDASASVVSHLYAAGAKANVLKYGNISLAAKADFAANFAASTSTENLNDFETAQQRLRLGVDTAYDYRGDTHGLRPHFEIGARLDFGAGESDIIAGAEIAGGIRYEYQPLRLSVDARGRALVYDTTGALREWGAGATIRLVPSQNGTGLSASLTPGWGAPQSRVDNMWQDNTPALTQSQSINQALTLRGELAYTFRHKQARITPLTQYSLNAQSQTVGLGTRLNLAPLSLELLGERIDHTTTTPADYRLRLNTSLRF